MDKEIKFIGNYKILDVIGKGGMARVYTAMQIPLNRMVVIKEMNKSLGIELRKRFKQEALITASLSHRNIVPVYDYFNIGQTGYLVIQYVDGMSLAEIIENGAPLHPIVAAIIACEVCAALEHAHKNAVIHRDIKPTNILISREGEVMVSDFGVAKDETARDLTATGTVIGTPCYMSPEQAMGKKITFQSDVYSLGIVLYEMVTGKKPFWGETTQEITVKVSRGKYKSPFWLDPHHSINLSRIINKALKKNLNRRCETAEKMGRELEKFIGWKNLARRRNLLVSLLERIEHKKQMTTIISKPKTKTKKKKKGKYPLLYVLFILIALLLILVLFNLNL